MTTLVGAAIVYQPTRDVPVATHHCRAAVWKQWRFFQNAPPPNVNEPWPWVNAVACLKCETCGRLLKDTA